MNIDVESGQFQLLINKSCLSLRMLKKCKHVLTKVEYFFLNSKLKPHTKEPNCLYPGDLQPFTRRPTFIVVDSDNSTSFANIPQHFDQPLVVLMSPQEVPTSFRGMDHCGCSTY